MQLRKEYSTSERHTALYALLTCTRSFEPIRLRKHHILPASEFEDCSSEEIDAARKSNAQAQANAPLLERRWTSLSEVDAAFQRFQLGQYGLCEDCGDEISLERLQAVPLAARCFDCNHERVRRLAPATTATQTGYHPNRRRARRIGEG
jgi:DnaK suppressor protein